MGVRARSSSVADLYLRGRANSLNAIRLVLAASVIFYHSYPIAGWDVPVTVVGALNATFPVNCFFAISGFLIYRSWQIGATRWSFWWHGL